MGTPDFAVPCLEALAAEETVEVKGVITQPDKKKGRGQKVKTTPVKQEAVDNDLEIFQPKDINSEAAIDKLTDWAPELIVVVAYGQILGEQVLNLPERGCVNVHASLLPKYRGAAPIHWSIINGEEKTGITTMYMDEGMDTGDMILKQEVAITSEETAGSLHDKLAQEGAELLLETIKQIAAGTAPRKEQDEEKATYAPKLDKAECEVDWTQPVEKVRNVIRGLNPWPGAYTYLHGQRLKLYRSEVYSESNQPVDPGTIVKTDKQEGIVVQTGDGQLLLTKLQPAGKQKMAAVDYLLGHELADGIKLGN